MGKSGLKVQHTDAVDDIVETFSEAIKDDRVRWDTIMVEEDKPSRHLGAEQSFDGEIDVGLVNGTEAYVLEVKTSEYCTGKAEKQVASAVEFFENLGYDVWGAYYVDEKDSHMDSEELTIEIYERFGGIFDKEDLGEIIEYQNTWGSFGYVRSALSQDLTTVDADRLFHESSPHDLELLEDRGVLTQIGEYYGFSEEFRERIEEGDEENTFMLNSRAYEKYDLN